jgi:hypothetical protein
MSYPTNWNSYCGLIGQVGPSVFDLGDDTGNVNRFGARFRAAKSFRGIELEGYSHDTAQGYSALCRVMFVWSAFESFMRIIDKNQGQISPILEQYSGSDILSKVKELDASRGFFDFIYERVNTAHKRELDSFRSNDVCNIAYLASAVRHIFAHGHLTPNANKVEASVCVNICNTLSDYLLDVMDKEFGARITNLMDQIYGDG